MIDRIRNDKGKFAPAAESTGGLSVQETPEREADTLNLISTRRQPTTNQHDTKRAHHNTSPLSIGIATTSRQTAAATVAFA